MKFTFLVLIVLYLIPAVLNAQTAASVKDTSETAPAFEFVTMNSENINSDNLKGKIVILDFWNSGCMPCIKSMPQLEKFYQKYKDDKRVAVYFLNSGWESIEKARNFANSSRKHFLFFSWGGKYDLPYAYDNGSATMKKFSLDSNPSTIIIDTDFRIRVKHSGYIKDFYNFLNEHVDLMLVQ